MASQITLYTVEAFAGRSGCHLQHSVRLCSQRDEREEQTISLRLVPRKGFHLDLPNHASVIPSIKRVRANSG